MPNETIITYLDSEISRLTKEKGKLKSILHSNPYSDILELQSEMSEKYSEADIENDFLTMSHLLKEFGQKKKELLAIADKQRDTTVLIKELLAVDTLLTFLNTQKFNESAN